MSTQCSRLISVYARKHDGDLLTVPFLVRCSNSSNGSDLCDEHEAEENTEPPETIRLFSISDEYANEDYNDFSD